MHTEALQQRSNETPLKLFDTLTAPGKVKAVLAVITEPIPKVAVFEWADINYDSLSDEEKRQIDAIFTENQDPGTYFERDSEVMQLRYILNAQDRATLENEVDCMSARRQITNKIKAKITRAREEQ